MLEQLSLPYLIALAISVPILWLVYFFAERERRIQRLGGRAPLRVGKALVGLDVVYDAVTSTAARQDLDFWDRNFRKYGHKENPYTMEIMVLGFRIILTADPENIKAVLATQFHDYGKGARFHDEWHPFLGDSIFTTDGEKWSYSRQLLRPQFIKDRVSDLDNFETHLKILMPKFGGSGETVDVLSLFYAYTLDSATYFLLGKSAGTLENGSPEFNHAFAEVQRIQIRYTRLGPLHHLTSKKNYRRQIKVIDRFINEIIDEVLALTPSELEEKSQKSYTMLYELMKSTRDRTMLRDQIITVLIAGRDTTACTLSWLVYQLSRHPSVVRKLRAEIESTVGFNQAPTYLDLKSMRYLQNCINETLRLYPAVPFNMRLALKDTTLPRGGGSDGSQPIGITIGTPVAYSPLYMQRQPDFFPPSGPGFPSITEFVPERWDTWTPKAWTHIPFNGGPRICIGQQFALAEMGYTITRIFQRYQSVESREFGRVPDLVPDVVLSPGGGIRVAFTSHKSG